MPRNRPKTTRKMSFREWLLRPVHFVQFLYKALGMYVTILITAGPLLAYGLFSYLGYLGIAAFFVIWGLCDRYLSPHSITRNYPVVGWGRFLFELVGPELRQYIVAANNEELPFNRDARRWVYASAKKQNNLASFGTDNDVERPGHMTILHSNSPTSGFKHDEIGGEPLYAIPCAKVLGGWRKREKAFRPDIFIVSAISYGSQGKASTAALNRGCRLAACLHNTGEGGVSPYHLGVQPFYDDEPGANLIWQIGTGYFGCRDLDGNFDFDMLVETVKKHPSIKAIEIKLSQGAKPGKGGILPADKNTEEVAAIRKVKPFTAVISPNKHTAFDCDDPDSLIDFVEKIAAATGLPVGIKSAVGQIAWWRSLAARMNERQMGPDYIQIDGGEGGTGAAPFVTADHVGRPFKRAFTSVYKLFAEQDMHQNVVWVGSAKLGSPNNAFFAFSLGCDMIAAARQPMMSIGCIQAQKCHTGHCPAGITTHNEWLMEGFQQDDKGARCANYIVTFRKELLMVTNAAGASHPAEISPEWVEFEFEGFMAKNAAELFGYQPEWSRPCDNDVLVTLTMMGQPVPNKQEVDEAAEEIRNVIDNDDGDEDLLAP